MVSANRLGARTPIRGFGGLLLVAVLAVGGPSPVWAASPGPTPVTTTRDAGATCTTATLARFAFVPRSVAQGHKTTLKIGMHNCTDVFFKGSLTLFGKMGCEVADPVSTGVGIPPYGTLARRVSFAAPDCGTQGDITGRLANSNARTVSTRVAKVKIVAS